MKWRPLSRRALLGGGGATVALPFLASLVPRHAQAATMPKRFLAYFCPNGFIGDSFFPTGDGRTFTLSPTLKALEPFKESLLIPMGLDNLVTRTQTGGNHAPGVAGFLTCSKAKVTAGADIEVAVSIDQMIASKITAGTPGLRYPSLQFGMNDAASPVDCDFGYSCAYTSGVSYSAPKTQLPKVTRPWLAFDRIFAGSDGMATQTEADRRRKQRTSVLDYVLSREASLTNRLSAADRRKLDQYFTSVRDLEKQVQAMDPGAGGAMKCMAPARPVEQDKGWDYQARVRLMLDLMVKAFECDVTRVQTWMLGNGFSNTAYSFLGIGTPGFNPDSQHHILSHHDNDAGKVGSLRKIDAFQMEQFAYLLKGLATARDAEDGTTLLDNTVVYMSSDVHDGNVHGLDNCRVIVAGKGGGALDTGKVVKFGTGNQIADLFTAFKRAWGIDGNFHNATKVLPGILKA